MVNEEYLKSIQDDNDPTDDGELIRYVKAFREQSYDMIKQMESSDEYMYSMQRRLELGDDVKKEEILAFIKELRARVGNIKKEEEAELGEERIAINLLNKLRKWVQEMV